MPYSVEEHIQKINEEMGAVQSCLVEHGKLLENYGSKLDKIDEKITMVQVKVGGLTENTKWLKMLTVGILTSLVGMAFLVIQHIIVT